MGKYIPVIWDIETTGLNPMAEHWWSNTMQAQVIAIGFATIPNWDEVSDPDDAEINVYTYYDRDEYELLDIVPERIHEKVRQDCLDRPFELYHDVVGTEFLSRTGQNPEPFLVGFNSRSFDHTYIGARFARKRLKGWPLTHGWKRLDMQRVAGHHGDLRNHPSQDDYAEYHDVDVPDEHDGSNMPEYFSQNNWTGIREHAESDVEELAKLFMRDRESAMEEFYRHYDIDAEPNFAEEADI